MGFAYAVIITAILLLLAALFIVVQYDCYTSFYDGHSAIYWMAICQRK